MDLDGFLTVVQSIDNFWLSVVKLPDGVMKKALQVLVVKEQSPRRAPPA